jgi:predicted double-glycine peptidase
MKLHTLRWLCCTLALAAPAASWAAELASVGGAPYRLHVTSLREARFRSTVRQQYDFSCGSAALATLLTYHYDFPVTEQQAFQEMFLSGDQGKIRREGFSLLDMKRFLAAHGFTADGFELPLDKLVQAKFPAIVLIVEKGYHHFVVVKGVQTDRVLLGDPSGGTRAMGRKSFEAIWPNHLLFVIHARNGTNNGKPHFNEVADWRVAPRAFLGDAVDREGLARITVPKNGAGEF